MVAIVRGLHSFDGRSSFSTWTHRVTVNTCLDQHRRRSRRPQTAEIDLAGPEGPRAPGRLPDDIVSDRLDIDRALAQLPTEQRVAVVLRDLGDLGYAEIAEALGVPIGTVRSRLARGRAALADHLGGNPESSADVSPTSDHGT